MKCEVWSVECEECSEMWTVKCEAWSPKSAV